jgi:hypothetical protein
MRFPAPDSNPSFGHYVKSRVLDCIQENANCLTRPEIINLGATILSLRVFLSLTTLFVAIIAIQACGLSPENDPVPQADRPIGVDTQLQEAVPGKPAQPRTPYADQVRPSIPTRSGECPKLESLLYQLYVTPAPDRFAEEHGIYYEAGLVRVVVDLIQPDSALPAGYQLQEERRLGRQVRVMAPLASLCSLSEQDEVGYVHGLLSNSPSRTE